MDSLRRCCRPRRGSAAQAGGSTAVRRRPRLTSRAAILVLVLAGLLVSYSSLMRAYLHQREGIRADQARIAASEAAVAAMESEIERHEDPAYAEQQARRLGMVWPGETSYVVLQGGEPLEVESSLSDPEVADPAQPTAWWEDAWDTMRVAGHPPRRPDPVPQTRIADPEGAPEAEPDEGGE